MGLSGKRANALLIAMAVILGGAGAAQAGCLAYGAQATLDGWVSLKPATAGQIAAGVAKNKSLWSIKLAKPACMTASGTDAAVASLPRVALAVGADQDKALRATFGKRIQVTGTLKADDAAKTGLPVELEGATLKAN